MEEWVAVDVSGLDPGATRALEVGGRNLLLCHAGGAFYALENRCPHAAVELTSGQLSGYVLECPMHGGKLDVRDGRPCAQPIRKPATTFAVRAARNGIEIRLEGLRSPVAHCAGADSIGALARAPLEE
jgi:nitrite reductase/ring-hydroxylating ferredoxin subunit